MCRTNAATAPSSVLMLTGVPSEATENDVSRFADGVVRGQACVKALVVAKQRLAFVQMGSREEAAAVMEACKLTRPYLEKNGRQYGVKLQYSNKQEINAVPRARNQITSAEETCRVLLVVLAELEASIQLSEVFWVFTQFGKVEKISAFVRDRKNQVLVQMATRQEADTAMGYLNGKIVPFRTPDGAPQSCRFSIVPSRLPHLTFKCQDKQNRDFATQNALLAGEDMGAEWGHGLVHAPLPQRLAVILQHYPSKFFMSHKTFVWGVDTSGTNQGILVPAQEHVNQFGTIPQAAPGIPAGKVGDCVHVSNIGNTTAMQLWNLMGLYGKVVAAKLLWKYEGTALVQFTDRANAQNAMNFLNNALGPNGEEWCLKESNNPNAMHWSGARTELDHRMVSVMSAKRPAPTPADIPQILPTRNVVLWAEHGLPAGMAEIVARTVEEDLSLPLAAAPQQTVRATGEVRYVAVMPSVDMASALVAAANGVDAAWFPSLHGLGGTQLGMAFVSDEEAEAAFVAPAEEEEEEDGLWNHRSETCRGADEEEEENKDADDDDEGLPRTKSAPY
eukprot:TRINITY_DN1009_c0_g1_i1.p1 TRINITY_DN1009_c0_g1~~TRINITY_DN1009_c0_g1_i1.p1  ORF type:complete len:561 (+),score=240.52 TRINITY_DN1009_c0_g1_i1:79-1761(+)